MPNFLTPEQLDACMTSPKECSGLIRALVEDTSVLIAIISGPDATAEKHKKLVLRICNDLIHGAGEAYGRLKAVGGNGDMVN